MGMGQNIVNCPGLTWYPLVKHGLLEHLPFIEFSSKTSIYEWFSSLSDYRRVHLLHHHPQHAWKSWKKLTAAVRLRTGVSNTLLESTASWSIPTFSAVSSQRRTGCGFTGKQLQGCRNAIDQTWGNHLQKWRFEWGIEGQTTGFPEFLSRLPTSESIIYENMICEQYGETNLHLLIFWAPDQQV